MKNTAKVIRGFLAIALGGILSVAVVHGENYYGEVMTVSGTATVVSEDSGQRPLSQGELVKIGDRIEVAEASHVDIAFDKEWNNVARVGEKTTANIRSVYPTGINLSEGDIFAKLHKLPKGSTFEIQTPIAVAAVRGSEYWTEHRDGATRVLNFSPSPVEVFALSDKGDLIGRTIVRQTEKTEIRMMNEPPAPPERMNADDIIRAIEHSAEIDLSVQEAAEEGRVGKVQDVDSVTEDFRAQAEAVEPVEREREEDKPKDKAKDETPKSDNPREDSPEGRGPGNNEPKVKSEEPKVKVEEPKVKVEEPKVKVEEPKIKIEEPKIKVEEPKIKIDEPKVKVAEPKIRIDEPKIRIEEPKVRVEKIEDRHDRDRERRGQENREDKD